MATSGIQNNGLVIAGYSTFTPNGGSEELLIPHKLGDDYECMLASAKNVNILGASGTIHGMKEEATLSSVKLKVIRDATGQATLLKLTSGTPRRAINGTLKTPVRLVGQDDAVVQIIVLENARVTDPKIGLSANIETSDIEFTFDSNNIDNVINELVASIQE